MAEVDSLEIRISAEMSEASRSIDKLCSRLDILSKSVGKIGSSSDGNFKKLNLAYSKIGNMFKSSSASSKVLTGSLVKAYAAIKSIEKGFDKLSTSVKNSMDFVETFNYWNVALDKISGDFSEQFEKYGYDSAEAYAKSFSERLKVLNQKLTGYAIGDSGELQLTDQIGVGLDIGKLMNYQAKILSVTNSVGLLGETSTDVSKVMSMLASDLSSLTNTDLDTVMTNLQSGLIGQSRALYRYGVDITNATLQTYAYEHGITKAVTAMSQGEKMQLRVLAILDQSKVAWGDVANTMNSVANQWRIMGQQVSNVSRLFGTLLLPIVQKVLPVVNGLLIALQKLMSTLGFKIWGDTWLKDTMSGISSGGVAEVEKLDESLGNASESAKKLKTHLLGIDELNVVEPADNSGTSMGSVGGGIDLSSDISAALAEYESVWDKAFAESLNKAQEYADKFISVASRIWAAIEPLRNSVNKLWNEGFSLLMGYTFQNLKDFYTEFLVPLGTWAFGTEGQGLTRLVDIVNNSLLQIDWPFITQNLKNFWRALEPFAESFGEGLISFFEDISNLSVSVINEILGRDGSIQNLTNFLNKVDPQKAEKLGYSLGVLAVGLTALSGIGKILSGIAGIGTSIIALSEGLGAIFGKTGIIAGIGTVLSGLGVAVLNFFAMWENGFSWLKEALMVLGIALAGIGATILGVPATIAAVVAGVVAAIGTIAIVVKENWDKISAFFEALGMIFESVGVWIENTMSNIKLKFNQKLAEMKTFLKEWIQNGKEQLKEIPTAFKDAFDKAKTWVVEKVQSMWDFVNNIINKIKSAISNIGSSISSAVAGLSSLGGKSRSVEGFASGGYPSSASLFWAGENGIPEILGTVNGKTAVAGGAEITGIRDAVYDVGQSETALLQVAVSLLETIAAKDTNTYIDGRELVNAYDERKTRNGFSFT